MDRENSHMRYICIMEVYSNVKKDELVTVAGNWIESQTILLSEISQIHK